MIDFLTIYTILDHITLAQSTTECVLVCDSSCAYFKVFKATKSSDIHQQVLICYDKTLMILLVGIISTSRRIPYVNLAPFFLRKNPFFIHHHIPIYLCMCIM